MPQRFAAFAILLLLPAIPAGGCRSVESLAQTDNRNQPQAATKFRNDPVRSRARISREAHPKAEEPALAGKQRTSAKKSTVRMASHEPVVRRVKRPAKRFPHRNSAADVTVSTPSKAKPSNEGTISRHSGARTAAYESSARTTAVQAIAPPPAPAGKPHGSNERRIDLSTSLNLVTGQNPQVAFVHERVREASAKLQAAESLWLPSVRAGANYNKHEGSFQDVAGGVFGVSRGSLYTGFGARAVGASSPAVPGLSAQFHLADAIFQPIIAQRTMTARQHAAAATTNNELLRAALAHLDLLAAVGRNRIAEETLDDWDRLAKLTASFARRGQGTQADADRAQTELNLQKNEVIRSQAAIEVAGARLAEVMSLGDDMRLRPAEENIVRVDLVSPSSDIGSLVAQALEQRPELSENLLQQSAAVQNYRRERYSPLLPHLGAGMSWGGFGGGVGDTITHYKDRFDVDLWAYWEVRNLGFGEQAAREVAHSRVHQTQHGYTRLSNQIRREITESHAELNSAVGQLRQTKLATTSAEASLKRNFQRIREGQGLPIEVLQSIRALNAAKQELLHAFVAYNQAQFRLHHALGWPAHPAVQ